MSHPILHGPHILSRRLIEQNIPRKIAGVYVLSAREGNAINARRIGRADEDLALALREFVGLYSHFSCAAAESPLSAYAMECELHHARDLPESRSHPIAPPNSDGACPVCGR